MSTTTTDTPLGRTRRAMRRVRGTAAEADWGSAGGDVVVLSGGGARGAAQAGMLLELVRAGVAPVAYVGCSAGALNAAMMSTLTPEATQAERVAHVEELCRRWRATNGHDIFAGNTLRRAAHLLRRHPYLYEPTALRALIREWTRPYARIEELPTRCRVVTANVTTGRPTYHDTGRLDEVLVASAAIPGVFPPVKLPDPVAGGMALHVDGGIADLIPLAGAVGLNPRRIFVLDVTSNPLLEEAHNPVDALVVALGVSNKLRGPVEFGRPVQVVEVRLPEMRVRLMDFSKTEELLRAGAAAAVEALATPAPVNPEGKVSVSRRPWIPRTPPRSVVKARDALRSRRNQPRPGGPAAGMVHGDPVAIGVENTFVASS